MQAKITKEIKQFEEIGYEVAISENNIKAIKKGDYDLSRVLEINLSSGYVRVYMALGTELTPNICVIQFDELEIVNSIITKLK